jgi:hypothetical protein
MTTEKALSKNNNITPPSTLLNKFIIFFHSWRVYTNRYIASELCTLTKYYSQLIQFMPRPDDQFILYHAIDCPNKQIIHEINLFPNFQSDSHSDSVILLNGVFNHSLDIAELLKQLHHKLDRTSRILTVIYNPYLSILYKLANLLGIRKGETPHTFITKRDLNNLAALSGFQIVRTQTAVYFPWRLFGIGHAINKLMPLIPIIKWLSLTYLVCLRPIKQSPAPNLSIVIPARNEAGNIAAALERMPKFPGKIEVIFVEGNSTDNTWEEILKVKSHYSNNPNLTIQALQQPKKGKADAVRLGFEHAQHELLTILDADLTMPPEKLVDFYDAYRLGLADFINGSRLLYPMEGEAMRPLNLLANRTFARLLSFVLGTPLTDTLCGTKLFTQKSYQKMIAWRNDFGDFDPFGDFEMIFPAAVLGLGIIDIPVYYRARTYGETNISRFRDGWVLLKMTVLGFFKIKL